MFDRDRWREIFDTIKKNKLRTALSGFTVFIGIYIFSAMTGMGNGLRNSFISQFKNDAPNAVYVYSGFSSLPYRGFESGRKIRLTNRDLTYIRDKFPHTVQNLSGRIHLELPIRHGNEYGNYQLRAVDPGCQFTEQLGLRSGRFLNYGDIRDKRKVAVIGQPLQTDLFEHKSAVGKYIYVDGIAFKVIGVFMEKGGNSMAENRVYVPRTTIQLLRHMGNGVDLITLTYNPEMNFDRIMAFQDKLRENLKRRHFISPNGQGGIYVDSRAKALKNIDIFLQVIGGIVTLISIGTLLAGAIGISNIMVFVVRERTREIGIRKALGATPRAVIGLILQESLFITTISGYLGLIAGVLTLRAIGTNLKDYSITNPYVSSSMVIMATVLLIVSGLLAGYVPARRAARIKPITALHDE
ncbi:MAG: ABC transporter permease [Flavobacteriales bacterium]